MLKRKLGTEEVSAIGFGAMSLTNFYGPTDAERAEAVLKKARDLGIDHLDTSNVYGAGLSEERIGAFLAKHGGRDFFKIATKAGITRDAEGRRVFDNSPAHLEAELDKSLKRLGVEQVALFYVHRREATRPIEEVTETLAGFIKAGKIRQFGFSEIAPSSLERAAAIHPVGAVQSEYSLSTRQPELGLLQRTKALGATMVAFSPVGRGLLTDAPPTRERAATLEFLEHNPRFLEPNLSRNIEKTERFRALAKEIGVAASALAIAWLLLRDAHVLPIPGTRSPEHLEELAAGVRLALSEADLKAIEERLPIGWAHGERYSAAQWPGAEHYC